MSYYPSTYYNRPKQTVFVISECRTFEVYCIVDYQYLLKRTNMCLGYSHRISLDSYYQKKVSLLLYTSLHKSFFKTLGLILTQTVRTC